MNHSELLEVFDGLVVPTTQAGYIVYLLRSRQRIVIPQLTMIRPGRWHLWQVVLCSSSGHRPTSSPHSGGLQVLDVRTKTP